MASNTPLTSTKLETLRQELAAGNASALELFWQEIGRQGTPLIEPIPDDDRNSLVTFICKAEKEDQTPSVVNALPGRNSVEVMTLLPGTDLYYKSYKVRDDTRESYQFSIGGKNMTDPLNPQIHRFPDDPALGFTGWASSVLELPDAPPQPWSAPRAGVPQGAVTRHDMHSEILDNDYRIWIYTPPNYDTDAAPYGFLLALDGWFYVNLIPTPVILDNLQTDGRLGPLVAIMVGDAFSKTRQRDMACYPPFMDFLMVELLPWVRQNYHLTDDPTRSTIVGCSLGGLMAAFVALHHADVFGNVLVQSGYFGWRPRSEQEDEWIARQFIAAPLLPLRFYIEAGLLEIHIDTIEPGWSNFLGGARYMRDVLRAKGYPVTYSEFSGGHNPMNWPGTLAKGLLALLE